MNLHAHNTRRTAAAFAVTAAAAGLVLTGCGKNTPSAAAGATSAAATSGAASAAAGSTASASAAATSSGSGSVTMSSGSLPFPTTVGDTWKYSNSNGSSSVNSIASNTQVAGGQQVTMAIAFTDNGTTTHASYDYIVQPNGEISLPTSQFTSSLSNTGDTVKIVSGGIFWPSAAQLASGQPIHTTLVMSLDISGTKQTITEHITSQGEGTQSVTVPAGTYNASVVNVQEAATIDGYNTTIDDKTWLASGIGPVQTELLTVDGGKTDLTNKQVLTSFTKG
jgi:hypothetical protein